MYTGTRRTAMCMEIAAIAMFTATTIPGDGRIQAEDPAETMVVHSRVAGAAEEVEAPVALVARR